MYLCYTYKLSFLLAILYVHALSPKLLNRLMKFDTRRLNVLQCGPLQALYSGTRCNKINTVYEKI